MQVVSLCPNVDPLVISYSDSNDVSSSFSCINVGSTGYIASGSARLTNNEISVTSCTFACSQGSASTPPKVTIDLKAVDAGSQGSKEGASVSISTEINLRTY